MGNFIGTRKQKIMSEIWNIALHYTTLRGNIQMEMRERISYSSNDSKMNSCQK